MSEREQYVEKAKARIDQWTAEIEKMKAKVDETEADAKIEAQEQLDDAREQRDEAEVKLKEMREAGDDAWEDMKAGFDTALGSISDAFNSAMSQFRSQCQDERIGRSLSLQDSRKARYRWRLRSEGARRVQHV
jgi:predicted  nucleic acid-binding Zn-ribbon protein